jgi:hemoglobin/transferrin/lactoferrin receptor protein
VFGQDDINLINEKLTLTIGGRVDFITVNNEMGIDPSYLVVNGKRNDNPPNQRIIFEKNRANNISWSATAGLLYHLTSQFDMTLSLARAFRAPSLEERFKYIDLGASVELGNPNLKPEDGYFTDLGIRLWNPRFTLKGNVYMNALSNLITGEPGTFVYSYTGDETQQDSLPAIVYGNIDKAMLYGFDLQFDYNFWSNIVLYGSASYVRGIDTKNNADLPLIPPLNGRAGIRYNLPGVAGIDFSAVLFADQNKVAQGETTTPGYAVYDMSVHSAQLNLNVANLQFFAGIENIFDRAYRYHLSTNRGQVQLEPGRNFYVKMNVRF